MGTELFSCVTSFDFFKQTIYEILNSPELKEKVQAASGVLHKMRPL